MATAIVETANVDTKKAETLAEAHYERWNHWPINWSAIWTGVLASIVAILLFGLVAVAIGAHLVGPSDRVVDLKSLRFGAVIFSVFSAFLSFVLGGWIAGKVAGILRAEPGMLHGAIVWLTAVPVLVLLTSLGAGSSLGAWYGGLASARSGSDAPYTRPDAPSADASQQDRAEYQKKLDEYKEQMRQWQEDTPRVTRNSALFAITALLLGLMGSALGGWIASGETLNLGHQRSRPAVRSDMRVQV